MAPTESASSAPKSPEGRGKQDEAELKTVQKHTADPSVTKILQSTVSGSDQLSDPAIKEALRAAPGLDLHVADVSGLYDTYGDTSSNVKSSATSADAPGVAGAEEEERKSSSNIPIKSVGIPLTEKRCIRSTIAQALIDVSNAPLPMAYCVEGIGRGFGALLCRARVRLWIL